MRSTGTLILAALATLAVAKHGGGNKPEGPREGQMGSGPPAGAHGPPGGWKGGPPHGWTGPPPAGHGPPAGWFGGSPNGKTPSNNWGGDKGGKPAGFLGMAQIPGAHMPVPMNAVPGGHGKPAAGHHDKHHMARDLDDNEDEDEDEDEDFSYLTARDFEDAEDELDSDPGEEPENAEHYDDEGNVIDKRNAYNPSHDSHQKWNSHTAGNIPQKWHHDASHGFGGSVGKSGNGAWGSRNRFPRDVEDDEDDEDEYSDVYAREFDVETDDADYGADEDDEDDDESSQFEARDAKKKPAPKPKKKGWGMFPW